MYRAMLAMGISEGVDLSNKLILFELSGAACVLMYSIMETGAPASITNFSATRLFSIEGLDGAVRVQIPSTIKYCSAGIYSRYDAIETSRFSDGLELRLELPLVDLSPDSMEFLGARAGILVSKVIEQYVAQGHGFYQVDEGNWETSAYYAGYASLQGASKEGSLARWMPDYYRYHNSKLLVFL